MKKYYLFLLSLFTSLSIFSQCLVHPYTLRSSSLMNKVAHDEEIIYFEVELVDPSNSLAAFPKKSWNRDYEKAHLLFGDVSGDGKEEIKSLLLRKALKLQHKLTYEKNGYFYPNFYLCDGPSLIDLIESEAYLEDDHYFSYSIIEDDFTGRYLWRFSLTDEKRVGYVSKHILHAGLNLEVLYSGEFRINDSKTILIDNNSGTYAPDADLMLRLIELLKIDFPLLDIQMNKETMVVKNSKRG